jgi:hypothetical protein
MSPSPTFAGDFGVFELCVLPERSPLTTYTPVTAAVPAGKQRGSAGLHVRCTQLYSCMLYVSVPDREKPRDNWLELETPSSSSPPDARDAPAGVDDGRGGSGPVRTPDGDEVCNMRSRSAACRVLTHCNSAKAPVTRGGGGGGGGNTWPLLRITVIIAYMAVSACRLGPARHSMGTDTCSR